MSEEILYNKIYEKTADCGRTQFIRLLMDKERENQKLKDNWNELKNIIEKGIIDSKAGSGQQYYFNTIYKYMQELEKSKDE